MASNPPFELEDQTDEDFFDNLVNDDDDDDDVDVSSKAIHLIQSHDISDVDESDELKVFADLNIAENQIHGSDPGHNREAKVEEHSADVEPVASSDLPSSGLRTENSCGVKEVQWSAFTSSSLIESCDDFFTNLGEEDQSEAKSVVGFEETINGTPEKSYSQAEYQGTTADQLPSGGDTNSSEYWETLYPGWKYDPITSQWYQSHSTNGQANFEIPAANIQETFDANALQSQVSHDQFVVGTVIQSSTTETVSDWNYAQQQQNSNNQYPSHMYFDPQYPGWYYDTIAQQWCSLEAYHASVQSIDQTHNQQDQNGFHNSVGYSHDVSRGFNNDHSSEGLEGSLVTSSIGYDGQQGADVQFSLAGRSTTVQSWQNSSEFNVYSNNQVSQLFSDSTGVSTSNDTTIQSNDSGLNSFSAPYNFPLSNHAQQVHSAAVGHSFSSNGHHVSYSPTEGRSSAGRPPHALVTFGFGGKLIVMKDSNNEFSALGSKNGDGSFLSLLNLMEVVNLNSGSFSTKTGAYSYFNSLCHQSFPGPLVGGNVGSKELYKWIDERISNCTSLEMNCGNGQGLKLLISLLKIACLHYGKLRSYGGDTGPKENDPPESAVAKLFASAKRNDGHFNDYNASTKRLMSLPSEAQIQATATEVQNLLISGRQMEALQRAQEGQLWEFALILARLLGEQFYADTVKQMAVSQLVVGSPLRTLCLLIARKPEEVFVNSIMPGNDYGAVHMSQHPVQGAGCGMLENWEENLAVITANRTENDHLVLIHLGDCLLKEKFDVTAAHICYLVADAGFELYSDSARLCLIGADHWNFPRTYASPEAIQRTELFEYAKVLGNSQFVLLQLQPYKLIYAHMLAEVGRVSDSLKYCQAVYKSLKIGRSPEADTLKQLLASLEERIKTYQQSGYTVNLAPTKIVGKLLNFFDSTAHRVVGALPPPGPSSTVQHSFQGNEYKFQALGPKGTDIQSSMGVSSLTTSMGIMSSQSTMSMSSLTPSASMEPINQWAIDETKMTMQNRSISEPDIGRTSRPVNSSDEAVSSSTVGKQTVSTGTSRFGRFNFGAQILQKTVGLVLKPRQGRQAKLGDTNKFYYDEKLKRWVEEGAEPPPEEAAPPPPPKIAAFQNGKSEYNLTNALNNAIDSSPGSISSIPGSSPGISSTVRSSNQFSTRGRLGVRSRYVDTFNKHGGGTSSPNTFQTPSVPSVKPASLSAAKFFIPMAAAEPASELAPEPVPTDVTFGSRNEQVSEGGENSGMSMMMNMNEGFQKQVAPPMGTMQRFSSMGNIPSISKTTIEGSNPPLAHSSQSRRTASWSAFQTPASASPEIRAASPLSFMPPLPNNQLHLDRDPSGDDLQEVEL